MADRDVKEVLARHIDSGNATSSQILFSDGTSGSAFRTGTPTDVGADPAGAAATVQGNLNTHTGLTTTAHGGIVASTDSRLTDARTPLSHSHGNITNAGAIGTTADLPVKTTTSGVLTTGSFGSSSGTFCQGNDPRLSDSRSPTTHATTHKSGGGDSIKLDELAAPTDVTTLNASSSAHGLLPKLSNVATEYMNGQGSWTTPASGAGEWWGRIANATAISITGAVTATIDRLHYVTGTSADYDITLPAASSNSGKVVGFVVKDWAAANKQFRLDAGTGVKIAGRTRYLILLHTNVSLLISDGTDWQPLVLVLDTMLLAVSNPTIHGITTNPTPDASPIQHSLLWGRNSDRMVWQYVYDADSAGSNGTGAYYLTPPIGSMVAPTSTRNCKGIAQIEPSGATDHRVWTPRVYAADKLGVIGLTQSGSSFDVWGSTSANEGRLANTTLTVSFWAETPMVDW